MDEVVKTDNTKRVFGMNFEKYPFLLFVLILPLGTVCAESFSNIAFYNLKEERLVLSASLKEFSPRDVLILNFTGSRCKPCKEQIPVLLDFAKQTNISAAGKRKVFLWVVFVGDDFKTGKEYSNLLKLENAAETLVDPLSSSYTQAKISGLPTVFVLNSNREILFKTEGYNESGTAALKNFLFSLGK
ncbi:TlpA family protein disulfide reductase [Leptospira alstonii]|uniref:TlpA family protein disulfide reductase n=1 Tax=Leptospira alstonii TaxID=28452 RepID=UPI000774CBFA|nr:thioredoxin family protein [Leptospira alstonii]